MTKVTYIQYTKKIHMSRLQGIQHFSCCTVYSHSIRQTTVKKTIYSSDDLLIMH